MIGKVKSLIFSKKAIILLILLVAAFFFKPFGLFGGEVKTQEMKVVKVTREDLSTIISASGQIEAERQAVIGFLSAGKISQVLVNEGDTVTRGQLLAALDDIEANRQVVIADRSLKAAESNAEKVIDDIRLNRYTGDETGETQTQKNQREVVEQNRDIAYENWEIAKKHLESLRLVAPFDGVVVNMNGFNAGQNVTAASQTSLTLISPENLKFVSNIDETEFGRLSVGQSGTIILDAYPNEKFTAQITKIGATATKLATGGSVVPVELSLVKDPRFKHGLNGDVEFNITSKNSVLTIPRAAVRKDNGKQYVNIKAGTGYEKKYVTLGESLGGKVEVIAGVSEGDEVVIGDVKK